MGPPKPLRIHIKPFDRHIRGIPFDVWQRVKLAAVRREMTLGAVITEALREWLDRQPKEASE